MTRRQGRASIAAKLVMAASFLNSLAVTLPAVAIPVVIAGTAAYAFTFLEFPGRDLLFGLIVGLLIVPNQVALAPLLRSYGDLQLTGTYAAVYLTDIGFGMPLAVFIFRGFMRTLPISVIESAKVDGASHYQIFWRLVVPLSVPALAAFAGWQVVTGGAIITMAVPVLVFVTLQRSFIRGLAAGSVNG